MYRTNIDVLSRQSTGLAKLDEYTQQIITGLLNNRKSFEDELEAQTIKLSDMHQRTEEMMLKQLEIIRDEIRRASESWGYVQYVYAIEKESIPGQRKGILSRWKGVYAPRWELDERQERIHRILIDGLEYPTRTQRYEAIAKPHQKTFEWIYQKPHRNWTNFVEWLRSGTGIYWINGKAGSGKTTLMRYIHDNPRTRRELMLWAGEDPLHISSFFFWNSGTLEQKSQSGLLRSLLLETLTRWRSLIPIVLPDQWSRRMSDHPWSIEDAPIDKWSDSKLEDAFQKLVWQTAVPLRLCFFIDGLDEYDGSHYDIVQLFKNIVSSANVKVCVSSRPLPVFERAFNGLPSLRLQDLTFEDIRSFVKDRLANNDQMQQLINEEPERAPKLIVEIVSKAQGVFLWVDLVVASLLNGLQNFDRISDMQRRVELLPPDLENLYKHMLHHIEPFYREQASQLFQLVRAAREQGEIPGPENSEPLTVLMLSFAEEEETKDRSEAKIRPLTDAEILSRCEATAGRVKSRCRGLLEVHEYKDFGYEPQKLVKSKSDARIVYLHRTVRDFLEEPRTWESLLEDTARSGFDVNATWLRGCVRRLKSATLIDGGKLLATSQGLVNRIAFDALCYATRCSVLTGEAHSTVLDELDWTMSRIFPTSPENLELPIWAKFMSQDFQDEHLKSADLLTVAANIGLTSYIKIKLEQDSSVIKDNSRPPLLFFAVYANFSLLQTLGRPNNLDTVTLLLQHGANPNQKLREDLPQTIWESFLKTVGSSRFLISSNGDISFNPDPSPASDSYYSQYWSSIFKLLIQYKADPNLRTCSIPDCKAGLSPFDVAGTFKFQEAAEIRALLVKFGAKVSRRDRKLASKETNVYDEVLADIDDIRPPEKKSRLSDQATWPSSTTRSFLRFRKR